MFTWICPQCGREVPPSYDECPDCKERAAQQSQTPLPQPETPTAQAQAPQNQPPQYQPPQHQPQGPYQPPPQYQPPTPPPQVFVRPYAPPAPTRGLGMPVWLLTILVTLAGIVMVVKLFTVPNASAPMLWTPLEITRLVKLHPANA